MGDMFEQRIKEMKAFLKTLDDMTAAVVRIGDNQKKAINNSKPAIMTGKKSPIYLTVYPKGDGTGDFIKEFSLDYNEFRDGGPPYKDYHIVKVGIFLENDFDIILN